MISAREAFASIDRALKSVRQDEDRMVAMLKSATDEAERLRRSQAEGFRALARIRLDALVRDEVVGQLADAEKRALAAIESRRARIDGIAARRKTLAARLDAVEDERERLAAARDDAADAVDRASEATETRIATDPTWQAADSRVRDAEARAVAAEAKTAQAEQDRDEKRVPYESDPLFMYLWTSGYGTSAYRAGRITRYLDGKVAALVGYQGARANYHMLTAIPDRLREHADRLKSALVDAVTAREAVERAALEADGILPLEASEAAAEEALEAADAALEAVRGELAAVGADMQALMGETGDPALGGAIEELATMLSREDLRTLYRRALDTPTPEDDQIIKGLQEIERALVRVTAQAEEVRKASLDLARRRTELERSEQNFRRGGYDDPSGQFADGAAIGAVVEGILRGALSSRSLDEVLGKGYRRRKPRASSGFGGGLKLPSGGHKSGGRSGGFRTGGRTGGGGFKTGGRI